MVADRLIGKFRLEAADLVRIEIQELGQVAGLRIDLEHREDFILAPGELAEEIEVHGDHHDVDDHERIGADQDPVHEEGHSRPYAYEAELEDRALHERNDDQR